MTKFLFMVKSEWRLRGEHGNNILFVSEDYKSAVTFLKKSITHEKKVSWINQVSDDPSFIENAKEDSYDAYLDGNESNFSTWLYIEKVPYDTSLAKE